MKVLMRGGGDLASAVAYRLWRAGFRVVICDLAKPSCVRRTVSFCNAIIEDEWTIQGVTARRIDRPEAIEAAFADGVIPVTAVPDREILAYFRPDVFIDATLSKREPDYDRSWAPLVIGLGPAIEAGKHAHVVVETNRGHFLGSLIFEGEAAPNTGIPGNIDGFTDERVMRAPCAGTLRHVRDIGDMVEAGEVVATVGEAPVRAKIPGIIRGLIADGFNVRTGLKVGDVDPRGERRHCVTISDKGRNIAGGVLEAILAAAADGRFLDELRLSRHDA